MGIGQANYFGQSIGIYAITITSERLYGLNWYGTFGNATHDQAEQFENEQIPYYVVIISNRTNMRERERAQNNCGKVNMRSCDQSLVRSIHIFGGQVVENTARCG